MFRYQAGPILDLQLTCVDFGICAIVIAQVFKIVDSGM